MTTQESSEFLMYLKLAHPGFRTDFCPCSRCVSVCVLRVTQKWKKHQNLNTMLMSFLVNKMFIKLYSGTALQGS